MRSRTPVQKVSPTRRWMPSSPTMRNSVVRERHVHQYPVRGASFGASPEAHEHLASSTKRIARRRQRLARQAALEVHANLGRGSPLRFLHRVRRWPRDLPRRTAIGPRPGSAHYQSPLAPPPPKLPPPGETPAPAPGSSSRRLSQPPPPQTIGRNGRRVAPSLRASRCRRPGRDPAPAARALRAMIPITTTTKRRAIWVAPRPDDGRRARWGTGVASTRANTALTARSRPTRILALAKGRRNVLPDDLAGRGIGHGALQPVADLQPDVAVLGRRRRG